MQRPILVKAFDDSCEALTGITSVFYPDQGRVAAKAGQPNIARKIIEVSWALDEIRLEAFPHSSSQPSTLNQEALLIFDNLDVARQGLQDSLQSFRAALCEASSQQLHTSFPADSEFSGPVWAVVFNVIQLLAELKGCLRQHAVQLGLQIQEKHSDADHSLAETGS